MGDDPLDVTDEPVPPVIPGRPLPDLVDESPPTVVVTGRRLTDDLPELSNEQLAALLPTAAKDREERAKGKSEVNDFEFAC